MKQKTKSGLKIVSINRKARFNYFFKEFFEAGIVLKSSEVKSLRSGKANIAESYAFDSSGEIFLNSHPLHLLNEEQRSEVRKENVGFVFQSFELLPGLTALENVMLPSELNSRSNAQELATYYLNRVGLEQRLSHYPRQLSGGEQQRVAIARAFACESKILFADEPTGNLDPKTSDTICDLLFEVNSESDNALVIVTHDSELALKCDKQIKLDQGKII